MNNCIYTVYYINTPLSLKQDTIHLLLTLNLQVKVLAVDCLTTIIMAAAHKILFYSKNT